MLGWQGERPSIDLATVAGYVCRIGDWQMNALARIVTVNEQHGRPRAGRHAAARLTVSKAALDDAFEDAQLNAIADERVDGPFVRVSLDDL